MPKDFVGGPVLTPAELDEMTPEQRRAAFDASVVTDLDQLPTAYLARLRADAKNRLARRELDAGNNARNVPHAS